MCFLQAPSIVRTPYCVEMNNSSPPTLYPVFWALDKKQLAKTILIYMRRVPSKKYYLYVLIME